MKTLLILRHAKSSWKDRELDDHDRPLNKRGQRAAQVMGQLMRREKIVPDLVICSSAQRARSTADLVIDAAGYDGPTIFSEQLYHASPPSYITVLRQVDAKVGRVLVVGHNPGLEELLADLTEAEIDLPTAALAEVGVPIEPWADLRLDGGCELRNVWRPRDLVDYDA